MGAVKLNEVQRWKEGTVSALRSWWKQNCRKRDQREGPPRTDKQWKIQTLKLLDKRVGMELSKVLGVPVFVLSYKEVRPDQAFS